MYITNKPMAISSVIILGLSLIMLIIAMFESSLLAWLAPEPRFYIPTLGFVIGAFLLSCCISKEE
ncbi:hypothetical protein [Saccharolobus caldissimus]|uniref:Uncharacterized protein n=1 Tax=Saccharolobus caldissimus TaxID=1702097 RepID=A0AAQ4CWP0_9CREN|nr:hypothetical protein [Saccharolobus caldissimus]BDC00222.1 hypothetical protein SACC_32380 [Saccharolobus caldissimus]